MGYGSIDDLGKPDIGPDTWLVDLPTDAEEAAGCMEMIADAIDRRAEYYRAARIPADVQKHADTASHCIGQAVEAMNAFLAATESWVAGLDLPNFEKAG